ncbi:molybdopterin molybdotransferase MoeA [Chitinophaga caseinilytica]|uniref:Molybdopterin molybdenumtransferase n=1 Tax=Chitinophaga caseinilytica TaxID=2267521 RepID=A0ABZ2Z191_9BACT
MMTVSEAYNAMLRTAAGFGVTTVLLEAAEGRVLRETVHADRPFPPYDRVTVNGLAIAFESYERGQRVFGSGGIQAAGMPRLQLANLADGMEVMRGSVLPDLTDTIVPFDQLEVAEHEGFRRFTVPGNVQPGHHIHRKGADAHAGKPLLEPGVRIGPAEIGVLAGTGKAEVKVSALPKVLLVATGNELVEVRETPEPHQVRMSNVYSLAAGLREMGIPADIVHLADEKPRMAEELLPLLHRCDVLICTGAVGDGRFNHLPEVLAEAGMEKIVDGVGQKPGKKILFGRMSGGPVVFALPGNPQSVMTNYARYIRPWLEVCLGLPDRKPVLAKLSETLTFARPLEYFIPVKLYVSGEAVLQALPIPHQGSGDLSALALADGFMALPSTSNVFEAGNAFPVWIFRQNSPF